MSPAPLISGEVFGNARAPARVVWPPVPRAKIWYLDLHVWISLARVAHGAADPRDAASLAFLAEARRAVAERRAIFPLSGMLLLEFFKQHDVQRRGRLATTMIELSRGWCYAPSSELLFGEVISSITGERTSLPTVARLGPGYGTGVVVGPHHRIDLPVGALASDKFSELFLSDSGEDLRRVGFEKIRALEDDRVPREQRARPLVDELGAVRFSWEYLYALTNDCRVTMMRALHAAGYIRRIETFVSPRELAAIGAQIPQFHVETALVLQRNLQRSRAVSRTDCFDLEHLAIGIPYSDFMIAERFWADLVQREELGQRYGCTVTGDVNVGAQHLADGAAGFEPLADRPTSVSAADVDPRVARAAADSRHPLVAEATTSAPSTTSSTQR